MTHLKKGDKLLSDDGNKEFTVDSLIHTGTGQGDIYKVHSGNELYALKLFHTGDMQRIHRQIERLRKRGRASSAFVHPLYIVAVDDKIGYVMEYLSKDEYTDASILFNGREKQLKNGNTVREELLLHEKLGLLKNIVEALKILFDADISLGDVKFDNIKINLNDGSIKILDTDTAVGGNARPMVAGTIGFMEPLVMRGEKKPNKYSDVFSLAVMIYMTLISGHPLRGRKYYEPCKQNIDMYTYGTNPVYTYNEKDKSNRPAPHEKRAIERMKKYPDYFKEAMHRTFVDGLFEDETKRTTPGEWLEILDKLYEDHFICKQCAEEHFYATAERVCHVCGTPIEVPISLVCEKSELPGVHLFNGMEIWSGDIIDKDNSYQLFKVVVSDFDKKFCLLCASTQKISVELKNGTVKEFGSGDVIPIFLDAKITVSDKYNLNFIGGTK